MISKTTYALLGFNLMLRGSSFYTNSRAETFAPLINCVIDDALLKMPDSD